ncbi:hypothetical protein D9615_004386 [Tricholomella constricta]|uniref:Uncharacterized protein n=1 Tax=Tricholomella constricta TaxID=117010 RepID=A0A8H5M5P9_9AGAR|nr:hypothetical protein D9615_004386 [Tricholomella constricta]
MFRHILHSFSRRPALAPALVNNARILAQPRRFTHWQSASERLDKEGVTIPIEPSEYRQILARTKQVWPCPRALPPGWSCKWEDWAYLLTFYWLSPYYLMLPQIEMVVNIRHRIPGETRPILFSNERQAFVFTLVDSPRQFFLFDGAGSVLYRVAGISNEQALVQLMTQGDDAFQAKLQLVPPDEEGEEALMRILARDATVIPLLAEKFLDYTPVPTKQWEEGNLPVDEEFPMEEFLQDLQGLEEMEKEHKLQSTQDGFDLEGLPGEEEGRAEIPERMEEDDDDDDDDELHPIEQALDNIDNMEDVEELMKLARQEEETRKTSTRGH